jgi:hypothetical protein
VTQQVLDLRNGDCAHRKLIDAHAEQQQRGLRIRRHLATNPNLPWLLISETLPTQRPASGGPRFRWQGQLINQWTTLVPGAGVALYEDDSLSALKALLPLAGREQNQLLFLPLADGSYGARLGSGNDFRVMETGICTGLRGRARCQ